MAKNSYSKGMGTNGAMQLFQQISWSSLPTPESEYRFAPPRRWRFDFAYPDEKIAIEYDGGMWKNGRHNRPQGFQKDLYKLNTAQLMGWIVLRFTPKDVTSGYALRTIEAALQGEVFVNTPDMPSAGPLQPISPQPKGVP